MGRNGSEAGPDGLPVLAVPYDEDAIQPMALAEAATGLCTLCFAIAPGAPGLGSLPQLMRRLGKVVELSSDDPEAGAERLAAELPAGVLCLSERALPLVAACCDRLGLPGPRPPEAAGLADKLAQRRAFAAHGLATPGCWPIDLLSDDPLASVPATARFPVVVKPRSGSGSRRTFAAANQAELADRLQAERAALAPVTVEGPFGSAFVVEERLAGAPEPGTAFADYCSAELAGDGTDLVLLGLTGRLPLVEPFRESGLFTPSDLDAPLAEAVGTAACAAVEALGAPAGCYHVEVKLTPEGPRVLEVNGRVGGTVPDLFRLAGGDFAMFRLAIRLALGEPLRQALGARSAPISFDGVAFRRFLQAPLGASGVEAIDGLEELRRRPGIVEIATQRPPGSPVSWRLGTNDYVLQVTGTAPDHATMAERLAEIDRTVRIRYTRAMLANRA